jgi:hypothetical protein
MLNTYNTTVIKNTSINIIDYNDTFRFIEDLKVFYPDFKYWFYEKVVPGIDHGSRKILDVRRNGVIIGIAILKKDRNETKLCTLKVHQDYQNLGIGIKLFHQSFDWLETSKPLLTVNEERHPQFKRIFKYKFDVQFQFLVYFS